MSTVVGAFILPHDPLIYAAPDAALVEQKANVMGGYASVRERIGALEATTAIIVGADHYIMFGPHCLPRYLIGVGDLDGPCDPLPGLERGPIAANEPLALHIMEAGFEAGFDWAVAKALSVDHSVMIPYRQCVAPNKGMRATPVYMASGVEPFISKRRAWELGRMMREAVDTFAGDERVVVIGSGGISHWVGTAEMGRVNEDFDRKILDHIAVGDAEALIGLDDDWILEYGGNGAMEIRHFLCAMGAFPEGRGEVLAYEAVPQWITGLGFAELKVA